jgi:hypothetical protein
MRIMKLATVVPVMALVGVAVAVVDNAVTVLAVLVLAVVVAAAAGDYNEVDLRVTFVLCAA